MQDDVAIPSASVPSSNGTGSDEATDATVPRSDVGQTAGTAGRPPSDRVGTAGQTAQLTCELIDELSDLRSNEFAYRFVATNTGTAVIDILSLNPRIPLGAKLVRETDPLFDDIDTRYMAVCEELSGLVDAHLLAASKALQEQYRTAVASVVTKEKGSALGYFRERYPRLNWLWSLGELLLRVLGTLTIVGPIVQAGSEYFESTSTVNQYFVAKLLEPVKVTIESVSDGERAFRTWFDDLDQSTLVRQLFAMKLEKLRELENARNADNKRAFSVATLEPGSYFANTYIVKFPRNKVEPRRSQVTIDCRYGPRDSNSHSITSVTKSLIVSADPLILTVIAVFASILGLTLAGYRPLTDWNSLAAWPTTAAFTGFVSAPILAAVAFNVYEHTSLGKAFQMNLGWRSALLIGTLCGLMEERILTALKALLGSA